MRPSNPNTRSQILTSRFIGAPFKTEAGMPGCFYHVTKSHK